MSMEPKNVVEFTVPLSGSKLFDLHTLVTAKKLCDKFPGLNFAVQQDCIEIWGKLNDHWLAEWNKAVFQIGEA